MLRLEKQNINGMICELDIAYPRRQSEREARSETQKNDKLQRRYLQKSGSSSTH